MKTITFECEIITPMFIGGADGQTPELRPPSIKGMMRFWWRALNGHLPFEELKKRESKRFGASNEKIGRSKFNIRIPNTELKEQKYPPFSHKKKKVKFNGISPHQKIFITLSSQYESIKKYADILKVSLILGGFGKRARRGFGSVRILNIDNQPYNVEYESINILKLINDISINQYKMGNGNKIELKDNITAQYPFLNEIQLGKEYNSWEDLLDKISEASHNHNFDSLGFVKNKKRLASPIYVSVVKTSDEKYKPIISTLNTAFEDGRKFNKKMQSEQNKFKEAIL
ncbi:MAG: type III-B CRISPR module RAMP protein Cmr1 [Candidatus Methanofastidiosa archaeon]|nr:type III-B CRISPR module RAMP protein Cmr1 [Candidatus Methanofastidiosa archaeon]